MRVIFEPHQSAQGRRLRNCHLTRWSALLDVLTLPFSATIIPAVAGPARVFLGSSLEVKRELDEIAAALRGEGAEVLSWDDSRVYPGGRTYIESLESIMRRCDAALLIATSDDQVHKRGVTDSQPRDNVILEYGMSVMAFGRDRTALAVMGQPRLPSDLLGVKPLELPDSGDLAAFRQGIKVPLRTWHEQLKQLPPQLTLHTDLPNLYKRIVAILGRVGEADPLRRQQIDLAASDVIEWVAQSFGPDDFSMEDLAESMQGDQLRESDGLFALDVLGPQAWVTPSAYRYLARQIRHYLRKNASGLEPRLIVSDRLKAAIDRAVANATAVGPDGARHLPQSLTLFDNPQELRIDVGTPEMEYARVLLWSRDELRSRVADTVITIHDQLSVPLFFLETAPESPQRDLDFLAIRHKSGRVSGNINRRTRHGSPYRLEDLQRGIVPGRGFALEKFWEMLQGDSLMFAKDARALLPIIPDGVVATARVDGTRRNVPS